MTQTVVNADRGMNEIICGNCVDVTKGFADSSIDLTVTSPPYDNLRDYKGYTFDFEGIARELYRVTAPGGVVVWNVADATVDGSETGTSFTQALFFKGLGFRIHDTMIYAKQNPMPLNSNRYENAFEYMFVFGKGKLRTFNPIMEKSKTAGITNHGTYYKPDGTMVKKHGSGRVVKDEKVRSNIWTYPIGHNAEIPGHPATFPEALARDHIISWSNEGDTVLDPMCGSGTTCKMAHNLKRNYIGIDISDEYCKIARERLQGQSQVLL